MRDWPPVFDLAIAWLAEHPIGGYGSSLVRACEPTALAAIALADLGERAAAEISADFLLNRQSQSGSIGISELQDEPHWPTALAMLAWQKLNIERYSAAIEKATTWALGIRGVAMANSAQRGHDSTLVGWPWVEGTHSWIEPTAMFIVGLKAVGYTNHERVREAVRLLQDRLLPSGGCNYGNKIILGQELRPHLQPSGIAACALAGELSLDDRFLKTLDFLESSLKVEMSPISYAWGYQGLAANKRVLSLSKLQTLCEQTMTRGPTVHVVALILNALVSSRRSEIENTR